ncbi:hypothetical protein [Methylorubrum extorquens]
MSTASSAPGSRSLRTAPGAFTDILGQARTVEALRTRVRTRAHYPSLILHGPPGVGRRTLARVYARGAYCMRPTAEGEPCGGDDCHHCAVFSGKPGSLGYLEYAPQEAPDRNHIDELMNRRKGTLDDRSVIVLVGADQYGELVFDRFLKTLQEQSITFIFLAHDAMRLPPPIRSRCVSYRLRPLARDDARAFLRARLPSAIIDERALDVLVAAGEGLPGLLAKSAVGLFGEAQITIDVVRRALDLTWAEEMSAFWQALLDDKTSADKVPKLPGAKNPAEQVQRMRVILRHLRASATHGSATDPALLYREPALLDEPLARLRRRAGTRHIASEELWRDLAQIWMSGDLTDADALLAAVLRTRRIVSGGAGE